MAGSFEDYGLLPELCSAVLSMGWHLPTDIQAECIPLILGGGDVMAAAETGSGKTGAFCLPLVQIVHEALRDPGKGGGGGNPRDCVMSSVDRDSDFAISPDGVLCQARDANRWNGGRGSVGVFKGRYYYEATVTDEGLCRVGWSTRTGKYDLGTDACGFGFGGTGKKSYNKRFDDYGEAFGLNDTIGCFLDADQGTLWFSKNGKVFDKAFDMPKYMKGHIMFPACVLKNAELRFNFGQQPFKHNPGNGFVGICQARMEDTSCGVAELTDNSNKRRPLALIIEPSLELAQQTHIEIEKFMKHLPEPHVKSGLFVGGQPTQPQIDLIRKGIDIVTGTPGRLIDLIQTKQLDLSDVRFFVLDEADRLMDAGNFRIIEQVYDGLDKTHLQVLMFSATLHSFEVTKMSQKICKFPTWVDLKGKDSVPTTVKHVQIVIDPSKTHSWTPSAPSFDILTDGVHQGEAQARVKNSKEWLSEQVKLLKGKYLVELINRYKMEQAIIFVRTRVDAHNLETYLNRLSEVEGRGSKLEKKYSCLQLHGGKGADKRLDNLEAFKNGEVKFLIATDVAARGIDIKELPFVVNYTLPDKSEDYIHRVGRVGRAGATGVAFSLVAACEEKVWYHNCNKKDNCRNTKLTTKGGCCIWYDEPKLMEAIEERLGGEPVARTSLEENFEIPGGISDVNPQQRLQEQEKKKFEEHFEEIAPMVNQLRDLEKQLQDGYFSLKRF